MDDARMYMARKKNIIQRHIEAMLLHQSSPTSHIYTNTHHQTHQRLRDHFVIIPKPSWLMMI